MIFAAGLGKRLGKITETMPKALVKIGGKSALHRVVEYITSFGFDDIIVNIHHFADLVEDEVKLLNGLGYHVSISDERELLLENGGGLYKAREFFNDDPFLLYCVDIVTDLNLKSMLDYYNTLQCLAVVAVRDRPGKRFLLTDRSGRLRGWCNTETNERIVTGESDEELSMIANSSVHIVSPEIFDFMHDGIYSMVKLYLDLAADSKIWTYRHDDGYWIDIGTPESLEKARRLFM